MSNLNDEDKIKKEESKIPKKEEKEEKKELTVEEELKNTEDKLLRSLAELENQRNRFEKDLKEAIDFGGFNFARENLAILDNLQRAYISIKNDETLKNNKDLDKFLKNIEIIEKDLLSIFKKNKIEKINTLKKKFDPNSIKL
jgi:molecular chaperone GrpE